MDLYLLRHGEADPRGAGIAEGSRALTPRGRQDVRRVLKRVRKKLAPDVIFTSPYTRAKQTAEIAAEVLGATRIDTTRTLLPSAQPSALWSLLEAHASADQILVAGHEPHFSQLVAFLLGVEARIEIKKGSLLRIRVDAPPQTPNGVLKWLVSPAVAR